MDLWPGKPHELQSVPFQLLDVGLDAAELTRNGDALRAMLDALFAADAVAGLADGRDGPVVAHEIGLVV